MKEPRASNMKTVIQISLTLCTIVYTLVGLFGYLLFENNVQTDLLVNYTGDLRVPWSNVSNSQLPNKKLLWLVFSHG